MTVDGIHCYTESSYQGRHHCAQAHVVHMLYSTKILKMASGIVGRYLIGHLEQSNVWIIFPY